MPAKAAHRHGQATELDHDVGAGRQLRHTPFPVLKDGVALPFVRTNAKRSADMVENDRAVRAGPRQVDQLHELGVVQPGVKAQAQPVQTGQPSAERGFQHQPFGRARVGVPNVGAGVPAGRMTNPPEAVGAGRQMRLKHRLHPVAQREIGKADNPGTRGHRSIVAAGALGGYALDKLRLTDRFHLRRTVFAVHRQTLDKDGLHDRVTAVGVVQQLVKQITVAGMIPQMMVWVTDGQLGVKSSLNSCLHVMLVRHIPSTGNRDNRQRSQRGSRFPLPASIRPRRPRPTDRPYARRQPPGRVAASRLESASGSRGCPSPRSRLRCAGCCRFCAA